MTHELTPYSWSLRRWGMHTKLDTGKDQNELSEDYQVILFSWPWFYVINISVICFQEIKTIFLVRILNINCHNLFLLFCLALFRVHYANSFFFSKRVFPTFTAMTFAFQVQEDLDFRRKLYLSKINICIFFSSELLTGYSPPCEIVWQVRKLPFIFSFNF